MPTTTSHPRRPNSPAQPLHAPHTLPQLLDIISRVRARMRARRVRARMRARALIARASIAFYSLYPYTNAKHTASPCRPSLPTTMQHHASQATTSQQLLTAHHNSRAGKVFPASLCSSHIFQPSPAPRQAPRRPSVAASRAYHVKKREKFGV